MKQTMDEDNTPPPSPEFNDYISEDDILEEVEMDDVIEALEDGTTEMSDDDDDEVMIPERDDSDYTLIEGHTDAALSCSFHPTNPNILVTGGMDNKAFVWDLSQTDSINPIQLELKESVDCVKFNSTGDYLAAADLDGNIKIYECSTFRLVFETAMEDEFLWLMWHPLSPMFLACSEDFLILHKFVGSPAQKYITAGPKPLITVCGSILPDGRRAIFGMNNGTVRVVDLKTEDANKSYTITEGQEIDCLDVQKDGVLVICGTNYGSVTQINIDTGKFSTCSIPNAELVDNVEVIAYSPVPNPQKLAASAHGRGTLRIWNTTRMMERHSISYPAGITKMVWHPTLQQVITSHLNAEANICDALSGMRLCNVLGHSKSILDVSINSDGTLFATASDDKSVKVYRTAKFAAS